MDVRTMEISLEVEGPDGFGLHGASLADQISRDPVDIGKRSTRTISIRMALCCSSARCSLDSGRAAKGQGFTHVEALVTVATSSLAGLTNRMRPERGLAMAWEFGPPRLSRR